MTHAVLAGSRFSADVLERLSCLNHGPGFSFAHSFQNRHVRRIHSCDLKISHPRDRQSGYSALWLSFAACGLIATALLSSSSSFSIHAP